MINLSLVLLVIVVICLLAMAIPYRIDTCAYHLRKELKATEDEIDELMLKPDYDLPTYEGKELRMDHVRLEAKAQILRKTLGY